MLEDVREMESGFHSTCAHVATKQEREEKDKSKFFIIANGLKLIYVVQRVSKTMTIKDIIWTFIFTLKILL